MIDGIRVWYHVRDLEAARDFYTDKLGFDETYVDDEDRWVKLEQGEMRIALAEGEPQAEGPVAIVDVDDVKADADRLRDDDVQIGTVVELHDEVRVLDVFDPDGNRIQLVQQLRDG
ncbi:MAG TPA: VOC family protein [Gaiellaceae bacterium]|nr:VOC family protein [Gaiellaceae bacterium]